MVAMARPAPLTRHPMLPSSLIKLRPYYWSQNCILEPANFRFEGAVHDEAYFGSLDFLWVFLGDVTELENVLLSEIGIVVETEFGIHTGMESASVENRP